MDIPVPVEKVLPCKNTLKRHILTHGTDNPFQCEECPFKGKCRSYLSRHIRDVHRKPKKMLNCKHCKKKFLFNDSLIRHERVHKGENPYKCDECGKTLCSMDQLLKHELIHTGKKPFQCTQCDYACRSRSMLKKHFDRHLGIKIYECDYCQKSYDRKYTLRNHILGSHSASDVGDYACDKCPSSYKTNNALQRHKKAGHDRGKTCKCPVCGKFISRSNRLAEHMRYHEAATPYACTYEGCTSQFKGKSDLNKHMVIHYPEMRVSCPHCDRSYSRKERLQEHIRKMHDKEVTLHDKEGKKHQCHYCGVCFLTESYLREHIQSKHGRDKQYICDACGYETHNKPSIVMHIKHTHAQIDCKVCGKKYKWNAHLQRHYKNCHGGELQTNARTLPEMKTLDSSDRDIDEE